MNNVITETRLVPIDVTSMTIAELNNLEGVDSITQYGDRCIAFFLVEVSYG